MLARLPIGWLVAMAAFATAVLCLGVQRCARTRGPVAKTAVLSFAFLLVMTGMGRLGIVPWDARQMMVMYSFVWVGFTIGALPSGKRLREAFAAGDRRPESDAPALPVRYVVFMCVAVTLALFLAFPLAM
jgi:hypothetical protein